ncbi:hypothetical protein LCGC14_0468910 [marine sediment metagenome]|uniref:Uncharacterized protein n=1 Tax=marine sediment metagenome TaxID=412755 RepID=A0A0F9SCU3_9ZZZZ
MTIRDCEQRDRDPDRPAIEQRVCLFSKDGTELLGRHPDAESAKAQEAAIHARGGSVRNTMKKYIKLAEVPDSAIKSLYDQRWGEGTMKALGEDFPLDSKAAQFLFHSVWNAVIQLMDKSLMGQKVDTTEFAQDPTFMQSLAGLAYFVTDDAIKSSLGIKSDSLQKGTGYAEALMAVLGKEADAAATLEGLKQKAAPIVDKAFDQVTQYLKEAPAEPQQKAAAAEQATNRTRAEVFMQYCALTGEQEEIEGLDDQQITVDEVMQYYRDADEAAVVELVDEFNDGVWLNDVQEFLHDADTVLENHGVEVLDLGSEAERWKMDYDEAAIAYYSNTGDTYHPTFLWDIGNEQMLFTDWGDFVEGWELKRQQELGDEYQSDEDFYGAETQTKDVVAETDESDDSPAAKQDIVAAAKEAAPENPTLAESADASIDIWAQGLPRDAAGPATVWLYPIIAMDASPDQWLATAETEGLYVPAAKYDIPYVQEYLQRELNDQLATRLTADTRAGTVGTFLYAEQDNKWGLQYETPAVEDVIAHMESVEPTEAAVPVCSDEEQHRAEVHQQLDAMGLEQEIIALAAEATAPKMVQHRGQLYREATEQEAREARETSRGPDHRPLGRDRDSRAPSMQLTQQIGKLPRGKQKQKRKPVEPDAKDEKESLLLRGLKWLDKKSHEAAAPRSRWGRLRTADIRTAEPIFATIVYDPNYSGIGKFNNNVDEAVHEMALDGWGEAIGDVEELGHYDLLKFGIDDPLVVDYGDHEDRVEAAIVETSNQGFVQVHYFDSEREAESAWTDVEAKYDEFYDEVELENPGYFA